MGMASFPRPCHWPYWLGSLGLPRGRLLGLAVIGTPSHVPSFPPNFWISVERSALAPCTAVMLPTPRSVDVLRGPGHVVGQAPRGAQQQQEQEQEAASTAPDCSRDLSGATRSGRARCAVCRAPRTTARVGRPTADAADGASPPAGRRMQMFTASTFTSLVFARRPRYWRKPPGPPNLAPSSCTNRLGRCST